MSNSSFYCYLPIIILVLFLLINKKDTEKHIEMKLKRRKGDKEMQELAKRFIGKDVLINTISSGSADGILKEVTDNAVMLEKDGKETVINLDYVIRLREYPKNKNGKRKSVILD